MKRQRSFTLIEVLIALAVFSVFAATLGAAMTVSSQATRDSSTRQRALRALNNQISTLQESANADLANVFSTHHGISVELSAAAQLPGPGPTGYAEVTTTFWRDEDALPSEFGTTAKDLNLDGDTDDEPPGYDLKLLPTRVTVTWIEPQGSGTVTRTLSSHLYLTRLAN